MWPTSVWFPEESALHRRACSGSYWRLGLGNLSAGDSVQ